MERKLIREKPCADAISVSVRTLRYWRRRRVIPFLKVGALVMYDLDEVLEALKSYKRDSIKLHPIVVPPRSRKKAKKIAPAKPTEHEDEACPVQ